MIVIGLTGGIGMGKSTATATLRRLRIPVFDADAAVHRLQARGGRAVAPIAAAFPGCVRDCRVDREALRRAVLGNPAALKRLEAIVWPLVRDAERRFLARARRNGQGIVVLDVPLLFENGGQRRVDQVIVVSAPAAVQRARVLRRAGMTAERFAAIHARQMPDAEKRRRADHVVRTGISRHFAQAAIRRVVRKLRGSAPHPARGRRAP
ncbi:dephospho-CoA kinase [Roseomonas sp. CECT 9278]|uniref:dephospho-CoA kinase n=1 Tax=Roseomonas sp. CECT 9278 TaxID=2845823 RepID=UPI001E5B8DCC|nr:dephospho-CoA kinase [Roseomonas sp. CECT 9278]CAH0145719.1 Dephospho-CoA kinase [Roseomonas sp. CECT 9278]